MYTIYLTSLKHEPIPTTQHASKREALDALFLRMQIFAGLGLGLEVRKS